MKSIFVSSTFKDMQRERDILGAKVIPFINEEARKCGDEISLCDLRWGINTLSESEEQSNIKILSTCLGEIDNCRPFMIVFLGDRYGWIPSEKLMKYTVQNASRLELENYDLSVTALEIEYGAFFDNNQLERTLFYFRKTKGEVPEYFTEKDEKSFNKLQALKNRIKNTPGAKVFEYTIDFTTEKSAQRDYDILAQTIRENLTQLLKPEWEEFKKLSPYTRELLTHLTFATNVEKSCYESIIDSEKFNFFMGRGLKYLPICSPSGRGTTTALCKIACERLHSNNLVLPIFCGVTKDSCDEIKITKFIIQFLNEVLGVSNEQTQLLLENTYPVLLLKNTLKECANLNKNIEIIIDGVDLLNCANVGELPFFLPNDVPKNVTFILSASKTEFFSTNRFFHFSVTKQSDFFDATNLIKSMLKNSRKELDDSVLKEIFYKKSSNLPLYLQMVLKRLSLMEREDFEKINGAGGDIQAICSYQKQIIANCPETASDLCVQIIDKASALINQELCDNVAKLICLSKYGVTQSALKNILENKRIVWDLLDFKTFMQYLDCIFYLDEKGAYNLRYPTLLFQIENQEDYYKDLLYSFNEFSSLQNVNANAFVYYCIKAGEYKRYLDLLSFNFISEKELALATAKELIAISHEKSDSDFVETFIKNILNLIDKSEQKNRFYTFFTTTLNNAFNGNRSYWRKMAYIAFNKDWATVNRYETGEHTANEEKFFQLDLLEDIKKDWDILQGSLPHSFKKQRLLSQDQRSNELEIKGKLFYFFNVPTKDDSVLYFMCNDYVLWTFYRSSAGDHCTYGLTYNEEEKSITVNEGDFCHYDRETMITTINFFNLEEKIEDIKFTVQTDTVRGNKTFPIYFKIKR